MWLADETAQVNRAIPADGQTFLTILNANQADSRYGSDKRPFRKMSDICQTIAEAHLPGLPQLPTRDKSCCFYAGFKGMNERIWGNGFQTVPFTFRGFTRYPEIMDETEASQKQVALRTVFIIIEELLRERDGFENELNAVKDTFHASMSWRVTAPLRVTSPALRTFRAVRFL